MNGVFLIDKPGGLSSFDVVRIVKKHIASSEVGHAGTLDPMATGLLTICVGQATKLVPYLMDADKEYQATLRLGYGTNTDDAAPGSVIVSQVEEDRVLALKELDIRRTVERFVGTLIQTPPTFSALRIRGRRLYEYARHAASEQSQDVQELAYQKQRAVIVHRIRIEQIELPYVTLTISCGKGTYIRSLARDIGQALGVFGHLSSLRRTKVGRASVEDAYALQQNGTHWELPSRAVPIAMIEAVSHLPMLTVRDEEAVAISQGKQEGLTQMIEQRTTARKEDKYCSVLDEKGDFIAILMYHDAAWRIARGFLNGTKRFRP